MSARHAWLRFLPDGPALPHALGPGSDSGLDTHAWQSGLLAEHRAWYGQDAPVQVSAVFVLQWLLQVPAHTLAFAATTATAGPLRADPAGLTFSLGPGLVPDQVRLAALDPDPTPVDERLARAERDYRAIGRGLALGYQSGVPLGRRTRLALVDDMWAEARRAAVGGLGTIELAAPARTSCCLIYALPGCTECAGCPRLRRSSQIGK